MRFSHVACFVALMGASTTPAYAYVDPGTGSMILQALLGAVAIGAASVSVFWRQVKSYFSGSKPTEQRDGTGKKDTPDR
jgi:hypothetical protein